MLEKILGRVIDVVLRATETLTEKEQAAQEAFWGRLDLPQRKTQEPVIIAMIGLVGSGKSFVAKELAQLIGATVINADDIRVELRRRGERYERARAIAENIALEVLAYGGNVIMDSDFIDIRKRAILREKARQAGVRLEFVCTYANPDVVLGRIITAKYSPEDFFGGASCEWFGSDHERGAVVKLREMWRRTPLHYRWKNKGGGRWSLNNPPCKVLADIDTSDPASWRREVEKCAKSLLG